MLTDRGYDVQTWGFGRNVGFRTTHAKAVEQKIRYMHHESGRKVSLVGWSLGGVFALYGAHQAPECVRQVITLGSPFNTAADPNRQCPVFALLGRMLDVPAGSLGDQNGNTARNRVSARDGLFSVILRAFRSTSSEIAIMPAYQDTQLFINGVWRDGRGSAIQSFDPSTGEKVFEAASATREDVNDAMSAARKAFAAAAAAAHRRCAARPRASHRAC